MLKACLTKVDITKVDKALEATKPASRTAQRLAAKQEELFAKIMDDKDFAKMIMKLKGV